MLKNLNKSTKIILICIIILYLFFIVVDLNFQNTGSKYSTLAKYIGVLLCFTLTIMIGTKGHDVIDTKLLQSAFLFTAFADYCLLISNEFIVGVLIFCIVQIIYIFRFTRHLISRGKIFICILSVYTVFALVVFTIYKIYGFDLKLSLICLLYACLIIASLITAIRTLSSGFFPFYASMMICIGMILFFMCDVNVFLFNILELSGGYFAGICGFLIWLFYLPAQVLLSLSGYKYINKKDLTIVNHTNNTVDNANNHTV